MDDHAGPGAAEALSPLELMLTLMREKWRGDDKDAAANLARIAAPYVHARVAGAQRKTPATMTDEELARWLDEDAPPGET